MKIVCWLFLLLLPMTGHAWPWTSPDDCVREHETLAQGQWSLRLIYAACRWTYADEQSDQDRYRGMCIIERIDEPKSEVAFMALATRCRQEAESKHPNPFDGFD